MTVSAEMCPAVRLETPIAKGILGGQFTGGHTVAVDVETTAEHKQLRFQQIDPSKLPVLV
jgi:ATP-dependent Clp protease ATP-binding subunit ClpB